MGSARRGGSEKSSFAMDLAKRKRNRFPCSKNVRTTKEELHWAGTNSRLRAGGGGAPMPWQPPPPPRKREWVMRLPVFRYCLSTNAYAEWVSVVHFCRFLADMLHFGGGLPPGPLTSLP